MNNKQLLQLSFLLFSIICLVFIVRIHNESEESLCFPYLTMETRAEGNNIVINSYYDENHNSDTWYFFLPSFASPEKTSFYFKLANSIEIENAGGEVLSLKNGSSISGLNEGEIYLIRFLNEGGDIIESGKISYMQSADLPSLFIKTASNSLDSIKEDKYHTERGRSMIVDGSGNVLLAESLKMIRGHGNTSWLFDKKPYLIKFDHYRRVLGMPEAQNWILIANRLDISNLRNLSVSGLAESLGIPAEKGEFADVYINGNYEGLYRITEKVEINKNRINIRNLENENKRLNSFQYFNPKKIQVTEERGRGERFASNLDHTPYDITGGYLIERNYADRYLNRPSRFRTLLGERYTVRSPEFVTEKEINYIADLFQKVEDLAVSGDSEISSYIDLESFAAKYLLEEFIKNEASGATSSFFYKDSDSVDPLIYAGPAWDFDKTLGNAWNESADDPENLNFLTNHKHQTLLFYNLYMKNEAFRELVKKDYEEKLRPAVLELIKTGLQTGEREIEKNRGMDAFRWHDTPESIHEDIEKIREFLEKRLKYCDRVWLEGEKIHILHFTGDSEDRNPYIGVINGDTLKSLPPLPADKVRRWFDSKTGERLTGETRIVRDMELVN